VKALSPCAFKKRHILIGLQSRLASVAVANCGGARTPFEVDRILYRSKARALTDKLWRTSLKWLKLLLPQTPHSTRV